MVRRSLTAFLAASAVALGAGGPAVAASPKSHPRSVSICGPIAARFLYYTPIDVLVERATGRRYRGAQSIRVTYAPRLPTDHTTADCHFIYRGGHVLHGPHIRLNRPIPGASA